MFLDNNSFYARMKINIIVEALLRSLKVSYSFINSIVLIILLRPFNEPLVKLYKNLASYLKERRQSLRNLLNWEKKDCILLTISPVLV